MPHPVHKFEGKYYFWDETQSLRIGPFACSVQAELDYLKYVRALDPIHSNKEVLYITPADLIQLMYEFREYKQQALCELTVLDFYKWLKYEKGIPLNLAYNKTIVRGDECRS